MADILDLFPEKKTSSNNSINISTNKKQNNKECAVCAELNINIKRLNKDEIKLYDFLQTFLAHIENQFTDSMFDDELYVFTKFEKLKTHCVPKGFPILDKLELIDLYTKRIQDDTIKPNKYFERLSTPVSNGEVNISCPSDPLESCKYNCDFCILVPDYARSYMPGQAVFDNLSKNKHNFIKYMLQTLLVHRVKLYDISKLAVRHIGGTFSSYPEIYRYTYSRDIFYCANVLADIIDNPELFAQAIKYLEKLFDPEDIIIPMIRKPFNYQKIALIEERICECKQWIVKKELLPNNREKITYKYPDEIAHFESELLEQIKISLSAEQEHNVIAKSRIVSYSIETRPDEINPKSISEFLKLGVTIVELGLQSPQDNILKNVNRGHSVKASKKAIRMLKNNGLHVHGQWMLDLLGSTKESDMEAVDLILSDALRCDQIKIYPHLALPGTKSKEKLDSGQYTSWVSKDPEGYHELMVYFVSNIDETTRIVRIQRDLPPKSAKNPMGYENVEDQPSNLEQIITNEIYSKGKTREDIRYHEPGIRFLNLESILTELEYKVITTQVDGGIDVYISAQTMVSRDHTKPDAKDFRIVWGYCRLRIVYDYDDLGFIDFFNSNQDKSFGRIRELKVNGLVQNFNNSNNSGKSGQHRGIGSHMLKMAEEIAHSYGQTHVTVTSSVGVRDYYRLKHGYQLDPCGLMWKKIEP